MRNAIYCRVGKALLFFMSWWARRLCSLPTLPRFFVQCKAVDSAEDKAVSCLIKLAILKLHIRAATVRERLIKQFRPVGGEQPVCGFVAAWIV
jgi:hypothetical protein